MNVLKIFGFSVTATELMFLLLVSSNKSTCIAFTSAPIHLSFGTLKGQIQSSSLASTDLNTDSDFSAFAETLEEDELFPDDDNNDGVYGTSTWQESLEAFLDPMTPPAKKQILLSDLVSSNEEIRSSLESALRERKLDPILTPTGKKLQDGTRAVARQITNDILPSIAATTNRNENNNIRPSLPTPEELPTLVPKIGSQILDAISTQAKKQVEQFQQDLADPARIPERISKQTSGFAKEARNVFLETPEGLVTPDYKVTDRGDGYEIREYAGYDAASTTMSKIGEPYSMNDITSSGSAFNALAAYIFGANQEDKTLEMTTPVITTSSGEMRFYISNKSNEPLPTPISANNEFNEKGVVTICKVAPARLAVARFTGFVTDGEIARQKDALLAKLANDGVELDVPHGAVVPHKIFQYNPPYTIPIVRRNEIAVPVKSEKDVKIEGLKQEWEDDMKDA